MLALPEATPAPKGANPTPGAALQHSSTLRPTARPWLPHLNRLGDELDDLIHLASQHYSAAQTWEEYAAKTREPQGDFHPNVGHIPHPAAHLLNHLRLHGAPVVTSGAPWSAAKRAQALSRGPHKSARDYRAFLRQEFTDMIHKGHWTVLPADLLATEPALRLSPLGVVPQRDRRPRTICDYTFFGVNEDTLGLAPQEAMQFGRALQRIIQTIVQANPRYGPVYISKIDISDGFYRVHVRPADIPKLAVLLPTAPQEAPLVGLPNSLPMGWKESPPYFSAATETVADLANAAITSNQPQPPHRLDTVAETPPAPEPITPAPAPVGPTRHTPAHQTRTGFRQQPLAYWDIYVDDFVGLVQGNTRRRTKVKRALLSSLDQVLRPLDPTDSPHRQEPASIKKCRKGDATWATRKIVLGWLLDTLQLTVELPPHRITRLHDILASIRPTQRRIATKTWHKILGELRSMTLAIPGARGLFSTLQEAFRHPEPTGNRLRLHKHVHDFLLDFQWMASDVSSRPTRLTELVPTHPTVIGACDASGLGMGGVLFIQTPQGVSPILWRSPFPTPVVKSLVSFDNPSGTITNSDLELAGTIGQLDVLAQAADIREQTIHNLTDNTPTLYWHRKGSTTTTGPAAYLLRLAALHQRHHRYLAQHDYIPGPSNVMADDCSRLWHLTDTQLLAHFESHYPQRQPWQLFPLREQMHSALISALFKRRSEPECALNEPVPTIAIGPSGRSSATPTLSTLSYATSRTQSPSSRSSDSSIETDVSPPATTPSELALWRTRSVQWARRWPHWGPKISAATPPDASTSASSGKSVRFTKQTVPRRG